MAKQRRMLRRTLVLAVSAAVALPAALQLLPADAALPLPVPDPTVAAVRKAGLGIGGWACNDAVAIAKMFDLGVDVFTTDRPDLAIDIRAGRQPRA